MTERSTEQEAGREPRDVPLVPGTPGFAWLLWIDGEEGLRCANATTLRASADQARFLENRLHAAFIAGFRAASSRRAPTHEQEPSDG